MDEQDEQDKGGQAGTEHITDSRQLPSPREAIDAPEIPGGRSAIDANSSGLRAFPG